MKVAEIVGKFVSGEPAAGLPVTSRMNPARMVVPPGVTVPAVQGVQPRRYALN